MFQGVSVFVGSREHKEPDVQNILQKVVGNTKNEKDRVKVPYNSSQTMNQCIDGRSAPNLHLYTRGKGLSLDHRLTISVGIQLVRSSNRFPTLFNIPRNERHKNTCAFRSNNAIFHCSLVSL